LRGSRSAYGIGLAPVAHLGRFGRRDAPQHCVAAVILAWQHFSFWFAWQAWHLRFRWHLATSILVLCNRRFVLRGARGAYGTGYLWWRTWARLVADMAGEYCVTGLALGESTLVLIGRRGIWRGRRGICRHLSMFRWYLGKSILVLYGRRGHWSDIPSFCVIDVVPIALGCL